MTDPQAFASTITSSIQAAKSAASTPDLAQPDFLKTMLRSYFDNIPDSWTSQAKSYFLQQQNPSLEDLAATLNEDIHSSSKLPDRTTIYQLLLRLAIVIYGIEGNLLRSTSPIGGPLF